MIPRPQKDSQGKIEGEFYPLQKAELIALHRSKLINNAAFVHLALRYENPYCDRPIEVIPKEFALRWSMPESSVYEAIAKLKEKGVLNIKSGRVVVEFNHPDCQQAEVTDCQQGDDSGNPESLQDPRKNSEIPEKILRSQKKLRKSRKNSEISENRSPKPPSDKASSSPKINKTYSNFIQTLSDSERENFEKFVRDEWKKLTARNGEPGEEIVSLERFLAREEDLKNWHQRFLSSAAGKEAKKKAIATLHDWQNDKRFHEWIWEAFNRGYEWVQEDESEREQRKAFYDWAMVTNAFEGVCL